MRYSVCSNRLHLADADMWPSNTKTIQTCKQWLLLAQSRHEKCRLDLQLFNVWLHRSQQNGEAVMSDKFRLSFGRLARYTYNEILHRCRRRCSRWHTCQNVTQYILPVWPICPQILIQ